jgi:hypothetical protein
MSYNKSLATLTNSLITRNSTQWGGGVMSERESSSTLTNCIICENSASLEGGGVVCYDKSLTTITNCTIWGNSAAQSGGGVECLDWSSSTVNNSIICANTSPKGHEISLITGGKLDVEYSNIAGGQTEVSVEGDCVLDWGEGNIDIDPLFANPGYWANVNDPNIVVEPNDPNAVWMNGDYHLKSEAGRWDPNSQSWVKDEVTSPCIDAGDPNSDFSSETWPHGERINMGAYGGTREASMSLETQGLSLPRVAYIYLYNDEEVKSFQSLLESYGCSTTLIRLEDVATALLDSYNLILVAHNTQYEDALSDPNTVAAIKDSGKPVVGLGDGGYDFFGLLGLSIGNPYGGHNSKNSIEVVDPNCSLFSTPYPINIPQDRALQLYSETNSIGIYLWPTIPETITVFGHEVNDVGYFPLVAEHNRYLLWGFTESPRKMTEIGKTLFINVVIYMANEAWEIDE